MLKRLSSPPLEISPVTSTATKAMKKVLPLGDNQYEDGTLEKFQKSYALTWGQFQSITHPVAGNHEYETPGAAGYYKYFGATAGDPTNRHLQKLK
jgi:hypothetical protein